MVSQQIRILDYLNVNLDWEKFKFICSRLLSIINMLEYKTENDLSQQIQILFSNNQQSHKIQKTTSINILHLKTQAELNSQLQIK